MRLRSCFYVFAFYPPSLALPSLFFSLPSRFPILGILPPAGSPQHKEFLSKVCVARVEEGRTSGSPLIALGVKCVERRQGRIAEWRATVRALLRAARGIENATVRHKVTRNVYLACRLLSSEEANPDKVGKAEQKEKGPSWYEKETRAAIRVITELASIPQRDLEQKFHSIHQVRPFRQDKTTLQSGQQEGPEREEPNP